MHTQQFLEMLEKIKETILDVVNVRFIYLYGSHAYGVPTESSDIDIYIVLPDNSERISDIYTKIIYDLSKKKIFYVDLLLNKESVFAVRQRENILESTITKKGMILYEQC